MADTPTITVRAPVAGAVEATTKTPPQAAAPVAEEPAKAPEAKAPDIDARMESYIKKEKQLRSMHREIEAEKAKLAAERQEYSNKYIDKARLTSDPLAVLIENGMDYNKLTEILLNQPNSVDPTIRAMKSEMQALKAELEATKKQGESQIEAQYKQAINQIRTEVGQLVNSTGFESIKHAGMQEAVVQLIEQTFQSDGFVMDVAKAAEQVENYLVEEGFKLASLDKVKAKLQPPPAPESASTKQSPATKTLTNAVNQQAPKRMTDKEKRERAIAAFHGKLQG